MILKFKHGNLPFTVIPNCTLEDKELSLKGKGLLAYLLSRPVDWQIYISQLSSVLKESKNTLSGILKELISVGYVTREQKRDGGKFFCYEYTVYAVKQNSPYPNYWDTVDSPSPKKPYPRNCDPVFEALPMKEEQKKEITNEKEERTIQFSDFATISMDESEASFSSVLIHEKEIKENSLSTINDKTENNEFRRLIEQLNQEKTDWLDTLKPSQAVLRLFRELQEQGKLSRKYLIYVARQKDSENPANFITSLKESFYWDAFKKLEKKKCLDGWCGTNGSGTDGVSNRDRLDDTYEKNRGKKQYRTAVDEAMEHPEVFVPRDEARKKIEKLLGKLNGKKTVNTR